jgi:hypothetical protein
MPYGLDITLDTSSPTINFEKEDCSPVMSVDLLNFVRYCILAESGGAGKIIVFCSLVAVLMRKRLHEKLIPGKIKIRKYMLVFFNKSILSTGLKNKRIRATLPSPFTNNLFSNFYLS